MAKRKGKRKMTAAKAAALVGALAGSAVFLNESGLNDAQVMGHVGRGEYGKVISVALDNAHLGKTDRVVRATIKSTVAAAAPSLGVSLAKTALSMVRGAV